MEGGNQLYYEIHGHLRVKSTNSVHIFQLNNRFHRNLAISSADEDFILFVGGGGLVIVIIIGALLGLWLYCTHPLANIEVKLSSPKNNNNFSNNNSAATATTTVTATARDRGIERRISHSSIGSSIDEERETMKWSSMMQPSQEISLLSSSSSSSKAATQSTQSPSNLNIESHKDFSSSASSTNESMSPFERERELQSQLKPQSQLQSQSQSRYEIDTEHFVEDFTTTYPDRDVIQYTENPRMALSKSKKIETSKSSDSPDSVDRDRRNEAMRRLVAKNNVLSRSKPELSPNRPPSSSSSPMNLSSPSPSSSPQKEFSSTWKTFNEDRSNEVSSTDQQSNSNDTSSDLKSKLNSLNIRQSQDYKQGQSVSPRSYSPVSIRVNISQLAELTGSELTRPDNISPGGTTCSVPVDSLLGRATMKSTTRRRSSVKKFDSDDIDTLQPTTDFNSSTTKSSSISAFPFRRPSTKRFSVSQIEANQMPVEQISPFNVEQETVSSGSSGGNSSNSKTQNNSSMVSPPFKPPPPARPPSVKIPSDTIHVKDSSDNHDYDNSSSATTMATASATATGISPPNTTEKKLLIDKDKKRQDMLSRSKRSML